MSFCSSGVIQWCQFDWQSFATLTTGLAAVIGAVIVGRKQAGIAKRQADISEEQASILRQQVALEEAKLRADLFQRRLDTYEVTADFVLHISTLPETDDRAKERIQNFAIKMRESQFLFSRPEVYEALLGFWNKGNEARTDRALSITDGVKYDPERAKRLNEYSIWSLNTASTLADIFQQDLSILSIGRI